MTDAGSMMEIRIHGRGGQGGVTCAKILSALYAQAGKSVQAFGDYGSERAGAPVRAYARVSDRAIETHNKVYRPSHVLLLDVSLMNDETLSGLREGAVVFLNAEEEPELFRDKLAPYSCAVVNAKAIAKRHRIGTRSVVVVNTTIAGAFVKVMGIPFADLEAVYTKLGLLGNLDAAREAFDQVTIRAPHAQAHEASRIAEVLPGPERDVLPITEHKEGRPTGLQTGTWRSQAPRYVENLAPCNAFCPAGNDVVGFVQALSTRDASEALGILSKTTPLAGVCGRVCPAPCMEGCNRREYDGAVDIRGLERWAADHGTYAPPIPEVPAERRSFAIVGAGPAGLGAAFELLTRGHAVTLFDRETALGGLLLTGIPSYRLPREVLERETARIVALGAKTELGRELGPSDIEALARSHDGVLVATGLQKLRDAGSVQPPRGVEQGIHFLRRVNLSGSARVSGHVLVLGGGNTAIDCARAAVRSGASRVTIVYRRTRDEMPAMREEIEEAIEEGVEIATLLAPHSFVGDSCVVGAVFSEVVLGPADETGRRSPVVTDKRKIIACDYVLLALGQSRDPRVLPPHATLDAGRVLGEGVGGNVFACGDFSTAEGTVTHAIGDGRRVAVRMLRALDERTPLLERPSKSLAVPSTDIRTDHFASASPSPHRLRTVGQRLSDFQEVNSGLESHLESHRCFACGHCTHCDTCLVYCPEGIIHRNLGEYRIDYSYCKGCGICVKECPRVAMEMGESAHAP